MRRPSSWVLILALPLLGLSEGGCASFEKSYKEFAPETPASLVAATASPEADALIARFYGPGGVDHATIDAALARAPTHAGLHEIAGFDAVARGDKRGAFDHFLAAAADRGALVPELYLWEMKSLARTTGDHMRAQSLLRALKDGHPRPQVRALAAYDLAHELSRVGEHDEAAELVGALGFVDAWQVVGAFDNDQGKGFDTEYPPERGASPDQTYAGVRLPVRFRPAQPSRLDGALQLADLIAPSSSVVAYAQTFVTAPAARQVDLRLTTSAGVRVWIGDKLMASDDRIFHDELDNVVVRVPLEAGQNRVLVKIAHEGGPFRLALRFTNPDGQVASDLRFSATGTAVAGAPVAGPARGQPVSPTAAVDSLQDRNRKRFLEARIWAREGHSRRGAWFLGPLATEARDNPVVALYAASAFADNGETGKALDLWSRGAARFPDMLGFLAERARFEEQHRLHEKAERDIAAILAKTPTARDPRMDLASTYGSQSLLLDRCLTLEKVVADWPDDVTAIVELARCKGERGYAEEAERLLRRARALAPGDGRVLWLAADYAERRVDYSAATDALNALASSRPGSLDVLLAQADLLRRQGKLAEARAALEAARALSPDAARPCDRLAELAYEHREVAEAERWWRLALEREPEDSVVAQRLASLAPTALPLVDRIAPTSEEIDRAVRSASSVKVHPGSHTVMLLDDEVIAINADGSSKRIVTQVTQAVTADGRDQLIQAKIPGGHTTVIEAYALHRGERQDASSVQGGVIRFRGLEVGSITVVKYAFYVGAPRFMPNEFVGSWRFQGVSQQVESSRWRLVMPKDRTLSSAVTGPVEQTTEIVGDQKVWTFAVKGAPPLVPEPNMTPAADELWSASVSTMKSWDGFARWEAALLREAFQPSPDLDALAQKLTAGATTPREKLDRLWAHVAQEIRYQQDYEDSIAGVKPHSAGMVVERGYGDCKDKAVLLMRLARAVGIELDFALLRTTNLGKVKTEIPNQQFNHAIVYVPKQAGIDQAFFIDTTTNGLDLGNLRTDDQGAMSLVLGKEGRWELIPIPYQGAEMEVVKHELKVSLADPAKVTVRDRFEARGGIASSARASLRSGEGAKRFYQGLADTLFPGTTVVDGKADKAQDITHPVAVDVDVDATNAVTAEDDRLRLQVPLLFPLQHVASLASRHHPLHLWRGTEELTMDVDLGDKQKLAHLPADFSVEHACFAMSRKSEAKGTHVVVRTRYRNTCPEIAPADYAAFRTAVQTTLTKKQDAIVWISGAKPAAPGVKPKGK